MARWWRSARGFTECSKSAVARAMTDLGAVPGRRTDGRVTGSTHAGTGLSTHRTSSAGAHMVKAWQMQQQCSGAGGSGTPVTRRMRVPCGGVNERRLEVAFGGPARDIRICSTTPLRIGLARVGVKLGLGSALS